MMKLNVRNKQTGIGLLELMLAMVIIAIMTLMSIQYFSSSKRNTLTTKAVDEIQSIVGIVGSIPSPAGVDDLNKVIVLSGQLPEEYAYELDGAYLIGTPWTEQSGDADPSGGGAGNAAFSATLTASVADNVLTLTSSSDLPNWGCETLVNKFAPETKAADAGVGKNGTKSGCGTGGKTLTLNFYLKPNQDL